MKRVTRMGKPKQLKTMTHQHEEHNRHNEGAVEHPCAFYPHPEVRLCVGSRIDRQRNGHNTERKAVAEQVVPDVRGGGRLHLQQDLLAGQRGVQVEACDRHNNNKNGRFQSISVVPVFKCQYSLVPFSLFWSFSYISVPTRPSFCLFLKLTIHEHPGDGAQEGAVQEGGVEAAQPAGLRQRDADEEQQLQRQHARVQILGDGGAMRLLCNATQRNARGGGENEDRRAIPKN